MSGKISGFLKRMVTSPTGVLLRENQQLLEEVCSLKEKLNEHHCMMNEARQTASAEQGTMFDEMTEHVRASQLEIIDSLYQQMMAAEMMRQKQTDKIEEMAQELAAVRAELGELKEMLSVR